MARKPGYVYIGYRGSLSKLGYTADPKKRFLAHRAIYGPTIGFFYIFEFVSKWRARQIESRFNSRMRKHRIAKSELYLMTNTAVLAILKDCIGPRIKVIERDPAEFIKHPEAREQAWIRDGEVPANDK